MLISYNESTKTFQIDTKNTSYAFCITNLNFIEHLYYGKKVSNADFRTLSNRQIYTFGSTIADEGRAFSESTMLTEISSDNSTDFREGSVCLINPDKTVGNRFTYKSHKIYEGREQIKGMPCSRADENTLTLKLELEDSEKGVLLDIFYVVFPEEDIIARHIEITNNSKNEMNVLKAQSLNLDFAESDFDLLEVTGMYSFELADVQRNPLKKGVQGIKTSTASTTHNANPFFILCDRNADEDLGGAYGFNLIYSGGFVNQIEVERLGKTRVLSGISSVGFNYKLKAGETFVTPEALMTFTDKGIGQVSRNFHDHIRSHIVDQKFAYKKRPIVVNSWEGVFFDVTENDIIQLAKGAKEIGADTVVLDDGWFRGGITDGLGDWVLDTKKFPSGLKALSEKVHAEGLKFGIWFEPECIAKESKFLKDKPREVLRTREIPALSRDQLVLDLTKDENIDYIFGLMTNILDGLNADYLKWDYNRYIHEAGSTACEYGELGYRQTLGVYKLFNMVRERYPDMMIENCSGGGGRFDLGMMFYAPQIWLSDNTNPYERAKIQYGATFGYPTSMISCHVTENLGADKRDSSFYFKYLVASMGIYGYEFNVHKLAEEEKSELKGLTEKYNEIYEFALNCDLYRIIDVNKCRYSAYMQVSKDKSKALFTFIQLTASVFNENMLVKLKGLDPDKLYMEKTSKVIYSGSLLMYGGIRLPDLFKIGGGGSGYQLLFEEVKNKK